MRQSNQISYTIVILNPIKVVYYPSRRQLFVVVIFPYISMFQNITIFSCKGRVWFENMDISILAFIRATLPIWWVLSIRQISPLPRVTPQFIMATLASLSSSITFATTIKAYIMPSLARFIFLLPSSSFCDNIIWCFSLRNPSAFMTPYSSFIARSATVYTRMLFVCHYGYIILWQWWYVNRYHCEICPVERELSRVALGGKG